MARLRKGGAAAWSHLTARPRPGKGGICLAVALSLASGCGLAEYEERLKEERARVKLIEQERLQLADPVDLPQPHPDDVRPPALAEAIIYFRPPKAFQCKKTPEEAVSWNKAPFLYRYAGKDGRDVFLACGLDPGQEVADFQDQVWKAFTHYVVKIQRRVPADQFPAEPKLKKQEDRTPPRVGKDIPPQLKYDVWVCEEPDPKSEAKDGKKDTAAEAAGPARYYLCFMRSGNVQVVIIYQVPLARAEDSSIQKGIDASLKSLAVGLDAMKRAQTAKRR